jgi:hypothetical protein
MGDWMDMERQVPPYQGLLIGGRLPDNPRTFEASGEERVRIRFLDPSGATAGRAAIEGNALPGRARLVTRESRRLGSLLKNVPINPTGETL